MHKVEQCDREAAADAVKAYRDRKNNDWQARIRRGECDGGEMVQAFAAHRIAERERCAEVVKACELARGIPEDPSQIITDLATAIRALKEPKE